MAHIIFITGVDLSVSKNKTKQNKNPPKNMLVNIVAALWEQDFALLRTWYLKKIIYLRWSNDKKRSFFVLFPDASRVRRVIGAAMGGMVFGTLLATYRGHSVPFYAAGMGTNYGIASFAFFGEQQHPSCR